MTFPSAYDPAQQAQTLQPCVQATIDLSLTLKQLHWNIQGPSFQPIHELLDEIVDTARNAADDIAERIVTLGHPAIGQRPTLGAPTIPTTQDTFLPDITVIKHTTNILTDVINTLRSAQQVLSDIDPVSEDLIISILADLEKHHWFIRSHLPS